MEFTAVSIEDRERISHYLSLYGENSCQHSFPAMLCLSDKYGDSTCERDGYLFVLRAGLCTPDERRYLYPMGEADDEGLRRALGEILADAHAHGARAVFHTLTKRATQTVLRLFPGRFCAREQRDYAEYLYTRERLADLPGHEMASKRYDVGTFYRSYGDRLRVELLTPAHIDALRAFQARWLEARLRGVEDVQLEHENQAIAVGLANFEALGLSGIAVYIDDALCGYAYGAPLSESCYDVIIEKGDRRIPDIYRVLNRDLVRLCCGKYRCINREEDLGVPGLRKAKLSYKPDWLLEKFIVSEVAHEQA